MEETRVALIGIMVGNRDSVSKMNSILEEYGTYIVGRMGIPQHKRDISVMDCYGCATG